MIPLPEYNSNSGEIPLPENAFLAALIRYGNNVYMVSLNSDELGYTSEHRVHRYPRTHR